MKSVLKISFFSRLKYLRPNVSHLLNGKKEISAFEYFLPFFFQDSVVIVIKL